MTLVGSVFFFWGCRVSNCTSFRNEHHRWHMLYPHRTRSYFCSLSASNEHITSTIFHFVWFECDSFSLYHLIFLFYCHLIAYFVLRFASIESFLYAISTLRILESLKPILCFTFFVGFTWIFHCVYVSVFVLATSISFTFSWMVFFSLVRVSVEWGGNCMWESSNFESLAVHLKNNWILFLYQNFFSVYAIFSLLSLIFFFVRSEMKRSVW